MNELSEAQGAFLLYTVGKEEGTMKYLKIFTDFLDVTAQLSDGAVGRLFRAMLRYAQNGTEPLFRGKEGVAWAVARQHIDREAAAYEGKVSNMERARNYRNKQKTEQITLISREDKDKEKDKNKDKDKDKDISFPRAAPSAEKKETHPSLEEAKEAADQGYF